MSSTFRTTTLTIAACFMLCLAGCGDGRVEVRGTVSYQGRPVPDGTISFVPTDPAAAPDAGRIVDGQFEFSAKPGEKRVRIRASRPLQNPAPGDPDAANLREDYIPAKYNTRTTLTAEVTDGGENEFAFELE